MLRKTCMMKRTEKKYRKVESEVSEKADTKIPSKRKVAMFSFCFLLSPPPASEDDDVDADHHHISGQQTDTLVIKPSCHDRYDLSKLLYNPIDEIKPGKLILSLMASPISSLATSSLSKHMTNSSSSSSLVTQGPSPARPSPIREAYKFEETCKCSYNVSTLNRIILLESVTKQTLSLSSKSQSSLETHLLQLQPLRDVTSKFEQLNRRLEHLKRILSVSKEKLITAKEEKSKYATQVGDGRDEMDERIQLLRSMINSLNGKRSELDQKKIELQKCRRQLDVKRAEYLHTISTLIYPIDVPFQPTTPSKIMVANNHGRQPVRQCSINGFSLPDSTALSPKHSFWGNSASNSSLTGTPNRERREDVDDHSCIAIGYMVHLLLLISRLTDIPLKYDIEFCGSKSLVVDHLNNDIMNTFYVQSSWKTSDDLETDDRKVRRNQGVKVTLYMKSKGSKDSRMYFKYGLYLVNQIVSQLHWTLDFVSLRNTCCDASSMKNVNYNLNNQKIDISNTLMNLHQLINHFIKSYPPDPLDKCLLTGNETRCTSPVESIVYYEAKLMLEANNAECRKENENHVHEASESTTE